MAKGGSRVIGRRLRQGGTYPHALHATHGPERSKGAQGSHRFERLNPSRATKSSYEVYKRDLMESRMQL